MFSGYWSGKLANYGSLFLIARMEQDGSDNLELGCVSCFLLKNFHTTKPMAQWILRPGAAGMSISQGLDYIG
jgi:hypothetical protein